jgi:hypothetical protein
VTALRLLALPLFSLLAAAAVAPGASAFDLTGSWEGRWSCKGFDGAKFDASNPESTLQITQTGPVLAVREDGGIPYNGGAIFDTKSPTTKGEIALVKCETDNVPLGGPEGVIIRAKVKADAEKGTGSFKGLSIVESGAPEVLTCKYVYKRTSTANPAVAACP